MKSINNYIVNIEKKYEDEIEYKSLKLYKNVNDSTTWDATRQGSVIEIPFNNFHNLNVGDIVVFHHNIVYENIGYDGLRKESEYYISDFTYRIPPDLIYGYYRDGEFFPVDDWCFIRPLYKEEKHDKFYIPNSVKRDNFTGEVVYPSEKLKKLGVKTGDVVGYSKFSEYRMKINGEILFRMKTNKIMCIYEGYCK